MTQSSTQNLLQQKPEIQHKSQALPIYMQIAEALTRDIVAGHLRDGERLKPERELAIDLGVSVGTLRKALERLTEKGLIEAIQGSGNYVRADGDTGSVYSMFRLELMKGGGLPRARLLDYRFQDKPDDLPDFGMSDQASCIRRLRSLGDTPIALEEIWLDGSVGSLEGANLSEALYLTYQKELGVRIGRAEDRVGLSQAPDWTPAELDMQPGYVCGFIERLSWADAPYPVEYSRSWFNAQRAQYVQRFR